MTTGTAVAIGVVLVGGAAGAVFFLRGRKAAAAEGGAGGGSPRATAARTAGNGIAVEGARAATDPAHRAAAGARPGSKLPPPPPAGAINVFKVDPVAPGENKYGGDESDPRIAGGTYQTDTGAVCTYDRKAQSTVCTGGKPSGLIGAILAGFGGAKA